MRYTKILALTLAVCGLTLLSSPVLAHEGPIGDGGPFRVELDTALVEGVEARLGNGEIELHVDGGMTAMAYGVDGEEMVKLDADGNMFANANSPTWQDAAMMAGTKLSGTPDAEGWVWVRGGGSMQYHDHRIHFMGKGLRGLVKNEGDTVFEFALPFAFNNQATEITGRVVFDPSLDPAAAEELLAVDAESMDRSMGTMPTTGAGSPDVKVTEETAPGSAVGAELGAQTGTESQDGDHDGGSGALWILMGAALLLGAGAVFVVRSRR